MIPMGSGLSRKRIEHFMELAIVEAERGAEAGEVPVGAVLIDRDENVLAIAHNCPVSSNDPTSHAEIVAMRQAAQRLGNYRLTGTTLIVTVEPCLMCAGAMVWARVSRVYFGAWDAKSGAFGSVTDINALPGLNHRIEAYGGWMQERCASMLKQFFRDRR